MIRCPVARSKQVSTPRVWRPVKTIGRPAVNLKTLEAVLCLDPGQKYCGLLLLGEGCVLSPVSRSMGAHHGFTWPQLTGPCTPSRGRHRCRAAPHRNQSLRRLGVRRGDVKIIIASAHPAGNQHIELVEPDVSGG